MVHSDYNKRGFTKHRPTIRVDFPVGGWFCGSTGLRISNMTTAIRIQTSMAKSLTLAWKDRIIGGWFCFTGFTPFRDAEKSGTPKI